jgi:hypothetical protein
MRIKVLNLKILPLVLAVTSLGAGCIAAVQAEETISALVTQLYDGKWPHKNTLAQLNNERFYQRGPEAYMITLPALNVIGMRDGSEAKFGKGYNVLPIWKDRMNARTLRHL